MKQTILLILLAITSVIHAQTFPDSVARWSEANYQSYTGGIPILNHVGWYYQMKGDTLIGGQPYKLIEKFDAWKESSHLSLGPLSSTNIDTSLGYIGAIRQTANKMVYFYSFTNFSPDCSYDSDTTFHTNTEYLLYDFNVNIGDTIALGSHTKVVTQIDSQFINNSYYKQFHFTGLDGLMDYWLEGMGSSLGLFGAYQHPPFEGGCNLTCFQNENDPYLIANRLSCDSASFNLLSIKSSKAQKNFSASIFPNPSFGDITVLVKDLKEDMILVIYNQLGQKVSEFPLRSQEQTFSKEQIGNKGLFILQISSKNEILTTQKVILY